MFVMFILLFNFTLIIFIIALVVMTLEDNGARIIVYIYICLLHSYS
jgi:hypothetical protein